MSGIKVRSLRTSIIDRPTKCSGKPSGDSAEKHVILLDLSKTKMVSCSEMRTFLAAGQSISKIFWTRPISDHRTYWRIHLWEEKYRHSRGRISCQNTEGWENWRLRWNPTWNTQSFEQAKELQRFKWNRVLEGHRKIRKPAWSSPWMDRCCLNLLNRALHLIGFQVHATKWEWKCAPKQTCATRGPPSCLVRPAWFYSWSWNGISNALYSSIFVTLISQSFTNKKM